jgi:hypothetical protein
MQKTENVPFWPDDAQVLSAKREISLEVIFYSFIGKMAIMQISRFTPNPLHPATSIVA